MKVDDLTSVFERPDVREVIAGHCRGEHDGGDYESCGHCIMLRGILACAIVEAAETDFAVAPEFALPAAAPPRETQAPPAKLKAPWTASQCAALNRWQRRRDVHPFTCGGDGCRKILVATEDGWVCPSCGYTQDWAHSFMAATTAQPAGWQPIATAPKNQEILVVSARRVYIAEYITDADAEIQGWYFSAKPKSSADWPDPTYWMPKPAPPAEKEKP